MTQTNQRTRGIMDQEKDMYTATTLTRDFRLELLWIGLKLMRRNAPQVRVTIGVFHVTQGSLISTQVENKIAYHSINWVKKLKYRRGVITKQRVKVSGMCDIPNSSYSAKGITENYSV